METDQQLIQDAAQGDTQAFAVLYNRYRDWVYHLAWRFTGDQDLALDVLQETWLYVIKKLPGLKLTAKLTTFLYPAVRNLSLNAMRAKKRFIGASDVLEELPTSLSHSQTLDLEDLTDVLGRLPRQQRQVVLMRFVDDMTINEIAQALSIPNGSVKSRLHHALKSLRHDKRCRRYFLE
jgi:RNA polymerase sigma-70 factor, ECF subfamily